MRRKLLAAALSAAAATWWASPAPGATCTFAGLDSNWHSALNWSCAAVPAVPTAVDDVVILFPEAVEVRAADASARSLLLDSGADLTVADGRSLSLAGPTSSSLGGTIDVAGAGSVLRLGGTVQWSSGEWRLAGGTIENGGTLSIAGNLTVRDLGSGLMRNTSTGTLSRASGAGELAIGSRLDNAGTVSVGTGRLTLAGGGTHTGDFSVGAGTMLVLDGNQTFTAAAEVTGGGTLIQRGGVTTLVNAAVAPALFDLQGGELVAAGTVGRLLNSDGVLRPGSSPGRLVVQGDYDQDWGATLQIEVAGPAAGSQFDVLEVSGHATLDGTLDVAPGYPADTGGTFPFLSAGGLSGSFASVTGGLFSGGRQAQLTYFRSAPHGARLTVAAAASPPPPPAPPPPPGPPPPPPPPGPPPPSPPPPPGPPPAPPPPPPSPPSPPPALTARCIVPNLKGQTLRIARQLLAANRCTLGRVRRAYSRRYRRGRVVAQDRRFGARLARGARVGVVVSRGRRR